MSDKIDWRTLKIGENVTVTFDAEVADTGDGFASFGLVGGTIVTTMDAAELDKATITKKEQPLKVGDRVAYTDEEWEVAAGPRSCSVRQSEVALWNEESGYTDARVSDLKRL